MDFTQLNTKEIKKILKEEASKDPDKYFATKTLKKEEYKRAQCTKCKNYYWSINKRDVCGDPSCTGKYLFINNSPCKKSLSFIDVYKKFAQLFNKKGYTPIKRYPTVARWNPTMEYTIASIAAFQPYVVAGEISPPANPLVIPQFCLRFGDIDNVGITGSHFTGFVMIGQHAFMPPEKYNQEQYFKDIHDWLIEGLGIAREEIVYHEDGWAGGGNGGCCMEYFVRGVEVGNQVYMTKAITTEGIKDLPIKVLDMGMGQERCAWLSQGTGTAYEAVFPETLKKLTAATHLEPDKNLMAKFVPHAGKLNTDETENVQEVWQQIAQEIKIPAQELKEKILPQAALYAIGEHARALLIAIADGALPSNVGGGYNLRILARRCFGFIDKYQWGLDLGQVCNWHAHELKEQYPELEGKIFQVKKILNVEKSKYENAKQKTQAIIRKIDLHNITTEEVINLYDSNGITPDLLQEIAQEKKIQLEIPDNFYQLVAQKHDKKVQEHQTTKEIDLHIQNLPETEALYFSDYKKIEFSAKVLYKKGKYVILDQTAFYPTSGGQIHDLGTLNENPVIDVFKQTKYIVHEMREDHTLQVGQSVHGKIDQEHREQLAQHHTATHIINAAARKVLGEHINQAGAKKTKEKAHIDLTHYQAINEQELEAIETEANKIIQQAINIKLSFMPRDKAEKEFGMDIYQGGAVPGKDLRIVNITKVDVECCGGTHLTNTQQTEKIKILKATKISDSIVRIEFIAGKAAQQETVKEQQEMKVIANLLNCKENQIPGRAKELFEKWKKSTKYKKENQKIPQEIQELTSTEIFAGDVRKKVAEVLKTQPEHVEKTIRRFKQEIIG